MSLTAGMRSTIKGRIMLRKETLAIIERNIIKSISIANSQVNDPNGIKSSASIMRAKKSKSIPPGERRISRGIFASRFPGTSIFFGADGVFSGIIYFSNSFFAFLIFTTSSGAVVINWSSA